jgi:hypothetical protein
MLGLGLSLGLTLALEEDVVGMSVADDRFCVRWAPVPCGVEQPAAATVTAALTARMTQDRDSLIIGSWLPVWTAARTPTNCTGDSGGSPASRATPSAPGSDLWKVRVCDYSKLVMCMALVVKIVN